MSKHFETQAIRTQTERSQHAEHSTPLFLTSSFVFEDAEEMRAAFAEEKKMNIYSRFTNPIQEISSKMEYQYQLFSCGRSRCDRSTHNTNNENHLCRIANQPWSPDIGYGSTREDC